MHDKYRYHEYDLPLAVGSQLSVELRTTRDIFIQKAFDWSELVNVVKVVLGK